MVSDGQESVEAGGLGVLARCGVKDTLAEATSDATKCAPKQHGCLLCAAVLTAVFVLLMGGRGFSGEWDVMWTLGALEVIRWYGGCFVYSSRRYR